MLRGILNKSWRQHPTKQQLYGHLPPITKTIKVRWTRHEGHCWRSRDELISDVLLWTPSHGRATSSHLHTAALRICREWWTIRRGGERESAISMLMAWQDDNDTQLNVKTVLYQTIQFSEYSFNVKNSSISNNSV